MKAQLNVSSKTCLLENIILKNIEKNQIKYDIDAPEYHVVILQSDNKEWFGSLEVLIISRCFYDNT